MSTKERIADCVLGKKVLEKFLKETFSSYLEFHLIGLENVFCLEKGSKKQVFLAPALFRKDNIIDIEHVSFIGVLAGSLEKKVFTPSIHLAYVIATYFLPSLKKGVIRLDDEKAKRFIFSKPTKIGKLSLEERNKSNTYLVLSTNNDPLGWGRESKGRLFPIIDAGWFFRSGG